MLRRSDRVEPEPWPIIVRTYLLGALAVLPALALEAPLRSLLAGNGNGWEAVEAAVLGAGLLAGVVAVGLIEEGVKWLAAWQGAFRGPRLQPGGGRPGLRRGGRLGLRHRRKPALRGLLGLVRRPPPFLGHLLGSCGLQRPGGAGYRLEPLPGPRLPGGRRPLRGRGGAPRRVQPGDHHGPDDAAGAPGHRLRPGLLPFPDHRPAGRRLRAQTTRPGAAGLAFRPSGPLC